MSATRNRIGNRPHKIARTLTAEKSIAPLAVLRMAFGTVLLISTIRFLAKGWVNQFYIAPKFHFPFYGFGWVRALPAAGMYALFGLMIVSSLFILLGFLYRLSVATFLIAFTYVELIDKTYYLNHYYFVSLFTFLLALVPAHRYFSLDTLRKPSIRVTRVPAWTILIFQAQLLLVYFFAGLSKLTPDWLLNAMPLRIWLPANSGLPVIGPLLTHSWVAFLFSWFGAAFDLSIGFLLLYRPTRKIAYVFVIVFHILTALLFKIGMFPYIMIAATVIFFSADFHERLITWLHRLFTKGTAPTLAHTPTPDPVPAPDPVAASAPHPPLGPVPNLPLGPAPATLHLSPLRQRLAALVLSVYFLVQLLAPFRYLLYPGTLFWTEQGFRFSWRVMLMEKSGTCFFYVKDPQTGRRGEVDNAKYLTPLQERMMATQPDMILQYAHYLHGVFAARGIEDPIVTVESYVTLNGSGSRLYIDSTTDLARQEESFLPKKWILPFHRIKSPE